MSKELLKSASAVLEAEIEQIRQMLQSALSQGIRDELEEDLQELREGLNYLEWLLADGQTAASA